MAYLAHPLHPPLSRNPRRGAGQVVSTFRTREDRQPTNEFIAVCPCPDGLIQDGTQAGGNEAYIILHRGARSRGYKRREREREGFEGIENTTEQQQVHR